MTHAERLADFVTGARYESISGERVAQLKARVLDSLGCAIGGLAGEPIRLIRRQVDEFGGAPRATLIGGGRSAPDRAAFYNGALVRYLDFNDAYVAKGESCHPSDNLGQLAEKSRDWSSGTGAPRALYRPALPAEISALSAATRLRSTQQAQPLRPRRHRSRGSRRSVMPVLRAYPRASRSRR